MSSAEEKGAIRLHVGQCTEWAIQVLGPSCEDLPSVSYRCIAETRFYNAHNDSHCNSLHSWCLSRLGDWCDCKSCGKAPYSTATIHYQGLCNTRHSESLRSPRVAAWRKPRLTPGVRQLQWTASFERRSRHLWQWAVFMTNTYKYYQIGLHTFIMYPIPTHNSLYCFVCRTSGSVLLKRGCSTLNWDETQTHTQTLTRTQKSDKRNMSPLCNQNSPKSTCPKGWTFAAGCPALDMAVLLVPIEAPKLEEAPPVRWWSDRFPKLQPLSNFFVCVTQ